MGPHENLRAHPDWDDYVHLVAGRPGEVALPAAVVEFPLERQPGEAAKWSCGECGDVFGSRLELWAHVAKNDLMDLGEAIDAWIAEAVAS